MTNAGTALTRSSWSVFRVSFRRVSADILLSDRSQHLGGGSGRSVTAEFTVPVVEGAYPFFRTWPGDEALIGSYVTSIDACGLTVPG